MSSGFSNSNDLMVKINIDLMGNLIMTLVEKNSDIQMDGLGGSSSNRRWSLLNIKTGFEQYETNCLSDGVPI